MHAIMATSPCAHAGLCVSFDMYMLDSHCVQCMLSWLILNVLMQDYACPLTCTCSIDTAYNACYHGHHSMCHAGLRVSFDMYMLNSHCIQCMLSCLPLHVPMQDYAGPLTCTCLIDTAYNACYHGNQSMCICWTTRVL